MEKYLKAIETQADIIGRITRLENNADPHIQIDFLKEEMDVLLKAFKGMAEIMLDMMTKLNELEDKVESMIQGE